LLSDRFLDLLSDRFLDLLSDRFLDALFDLLVDRYLDLLADGLLDGFLDAGHPFWVEPTHLPDHVDDVREEHADDERNTDRRLVGDEYDADGDKNQDPVGKVGKQVDTCRIHMFDLIPGD
jgi:hypothetical protein